MAATSVSQFGITWIWQEDRQIGQFANGDWWVVGPVTITSITPSDANPGDTTDMHGSMINPMPNSTGSPNWNAIQGFDSRIRDSNYNASLNIAKSLPRVVPAGSSVVSAISFVDGQGGNAPQLDLATILTVLASAPPSGSFRPPYNGPDKTIRWNKSQLDYSKLKKLAPVASTPSFATIEDYFKLPQIHMSNIWTSTYMHPRTNDYPNYGREIAHKVGAGALLLNLNYTDSQKEKLLVAMVQRGIDGYGFRKAGGGWVPEAGHHHGRKFPIVLAGWVLNEPDFYTTVQSNGSIQENGQHFYVSMTDVTGPRNSNRAPYTVDMIGMPEWGGKHATQPAGDGSAWTTDYRVLCGVSLIGNVLAARIMGAQGVWNHPATFDYMDRFYEIEKNNVSTGTNSIHPFVSEMWKAYRQSSGGSIIVTPPQDFAIGNRIRATRTTNVRTSDGLSATLLGTQPEGAIGQIIGGPVTADGITWWNVNFDTGVDGWSGGDNFTLDTSSGPSKPQPPTATNVQ